MKTMESGPTVPGGMEEATRMVREGRLADATRKIQEALGGSGFPTTARRSGDRGAFRPDGTNTTMPPVVFPEGLVGRGIDFPGGIIDMPLRPEGGGVSDGPGLEAPGTFTAGSYANGAGRRAYKLYVPPAAEGGEALPLIVMLHGCTQGADDFAAGTRMNALAEGHGFYVLYPEQAGSANMNRCWNWFEAKDQRRGSGEPGIIAGLVREVVTTHAVDPSRVYVAGMSAGGAMALVMAATHPDLFAAVGVHSGLPYGAATDMPSAFRAMQGGAQSVPPLKTQAPGSGEAADLSRRVPTIVFHGDADGTVNPRNGEQVVGQWTRGGSHRASVRRGRVPGGREWTRSVYLDARGEPLVESWVVHGSGHAWSGGSGRGSYTDPSGPDASAEMVRFFLEHPKG